VAVVARPSAWWLTAGEHCTQKSARTAIAAVQQLAENAVRDGRMAPGLLHQFSLTPKILRRTYACSNIIASAMLGAGQGLDLRSLQQAMGHESLETTAHYLSDVAHYLNRFRRPISVVQASQKVLALEPGSSAPELLAAA